MMAPLPVLFRVNGTPAVPANTVAPSIVGSPYVGNTVSADVGAWSGYPYPSFTYAWDATGSSLTDSTYVIQPSDLGISLALRVTATNASGSAFADAAPVTVTSGASYLLLADGTSFLLLADGTSKLQLAA
jgi:hypothetical protein